MTNSTPSPGTPGSHTTSTIDDSHGHHPQRRRWITTVAISGTLVSAAVAGTQAYATADDQPAASASVMANPSPLGLDVTEATDKQQEGVAIVEAAHGYSGTVSTGTGIVLTADGLVLTNNHVVAGSTEIRITIPSTGQTYNATVVGTDATSDIAVIELQGASGLTVADLDDDNDPAIGDDVTGVGNAYGQGELVAADGAVTALGQTITPASAPGRPGATLDNLIEVDADIVSGDSGGPLLDDDGEVVGVNTAASDPSTMPMGYSTTNDITAYAIPIDDAMDVADSIIDGDESDTVTIGYPAFLGVQLAPAPMDPSAPPGTNAAESGAVIGGAIDGTPAAAAGLQPGDTITAVDGTGITSGEDLGQALQNYQPGDTVTLTWLDTAGQAHNADVTLIEGPAD